MALTERHREGTPVRYLLLESTLDDHTPSERGFASKQVLRSSAEVDRPKVAPNPVQRPAPPTWNNRRFVKDLPASLQFGVAPVNRDFRIQTRRLTS